MNAVKYLARYLRPYRRQLIVGPSFKLLEAILELLVPLIMSRLIDRAIPNPELIPRYGILMAVFVASGLGCAIVCQYSASLASQGYGTDLRNEMLRHIQTFSFREIDAFGTAELTNRITSDVNQLQFAVAMLIRLVIRAPFLCIGGLIMAAYINAPLALIIVFVIVLFSGMLFLIMSRSIPMFTATQRWLDRIGLILRENLASARVIRAFTRVPGECERFASANEQHAKAAQRVGALTMLLNPVTALIGNLAILALLYFGGVRVSQGNMTAGEIVAFLNYIGSILTAMVVVANLVLTFSRASASAGRVWQVLSIVPGIQRGDGAMVGIQDGASQGDRSGDKAAAENRRGDGATGVQDGAAQGDRRGDKAAVAAHRPQPAILPRHGDIAFESVSYAYSPGGEPALRDISFALREGETLGIIGGTGSGKSTLAHLIPRLIDATSGTVRVSGADVRTLDVDALRGMTGIALQRTTFFAGSIAENLRVSAPGATEADMRWALQTAQALPFVEALTDGLEARLESGGTNLSGGQRQRLAIARALIRRPRILILDDSSSALDYLTDANLKKALREELPDTTRVVISQRASALGGADRILVLDEGRMVGLGSHEALMADCPLYREIVTTQEGRRVG